MRREQKFKLSNALIRATNLSLTTRKVAAVIYAYRRGNVCTRSIRELARLANVSPVTVQKAIDELVEAGFLQVKHTYRFDAEKGHPVRDCNVYTCDVNFEGGYTLIPYTFLRHTDMAASMFVIGLYLYQVSGYLGRAFPSISRIMAAVGVSNSTVCCALRVLKKLPCFLVQLCKKANGAFTSSSYFVVTITRNNGGDHIAQDAAPVPTKERGRLTNLYASIVRKAEQVCKTFPVLEVTRNLIHKVRNKITLGFTRGKRQPI